MGKYESFTRLAVSSVALSLLLSCSTSRTVAPQVQSQSGTGNPQYDYIVQYSNLAVDQMVKYGIPASITLAQGILESNSGRSTLAAKGNNHFGIKCHNGWTGKTMTQDDDRKGECFRVYSSATESFQDHSLFLVNGSRYADLFKLSPTDYKGWARGLKKAGYATSSTYADNLIGLIERYGLDRYDELSSRPRTGKPLHEKLVVNGLYCVKMSNGETLKDIAREFGTSRFKLRRYNELNRDFTPPAGSVIFLEKKKNRAQRDTPVHRVTRGESLWEIAQNYGIKIKSLEKRNGLNDDNPLTVGMSLKLR